MLYTNLLDILKKCLLLKILIMVGIVMNIAFDLDGVLFPIEEYQLKEGKRYFGKPINPNGYGIKDIFNCSSRDEILFWITHTKDFNRNVIISDTIKKRIQLLRNSGHRVYILTSRATANKKIIGFPMRAEVKRALKRNNLMIDGIIFTSVHNPAQAKERMIKKLNIQVMVEDNKVTIDRIKNITTVICVRTKNNKDYQDENVIFSESQDHLSEVLNNYCSNENRKKVTYNYSEIKELDDNGRKKFLNIIKNNCKEDTDSYKYLLQEKSCYRIMTILQPLFNVIYKPQIIHPELIPQKGAAIIACNHLHSFDPLVVMSNTHRPFHLLAKSELKNDKKWRFLFTQIGSIFVDNNDPISKKDAKSEMIKILLNGGIVMMFPEGTRNHTNEKLLDFHFGTVNVAQISGCPIIPVALNKDYRFFKNNLCAVIGKPMYVNIDDDIVEKNAELKNTISQLMMELPTN